jgi:predicted alpha/beta hydrolase family esterase
VAVNVLTLPGWQGSGPDHWQSRWEALYGYQRVAQHDWQHPLRGDWTARLEDVVADTPAPVVLVAHSLGCVLTTWWAAHTRHAHKVRAAMLVAPPDLAQPELAVQLRGWSPVLRRPLPFPALVLASSDDPHCALSQAQALAADWRARFEGLGPLGHVNAESGLGDWPEGHARLLQLAGV